MKRILFTICSLVWVLSPIAASAVTIAPSSIEVSGKRGEVLEETFSVLNTNTSDQTYYLDVLDFGPADETGKPQFFEVEDTQDNLSSWIQILQKEVTVPASTAVDVPFQVVLPDDVPSGGYYAAITVAQAPADVIATNGAIIEAKAAILVLLTIEGETIEQLALLDLVPPENGMYGTYTFRVQNQGNVHMTPEGTLLLKGMYGTTFQEMSLNEANGRVLPDSTRSYEVIVEESELPFMAKAWAQLRHGQFGTGTVVIQIDGLDQQISIPVKFQQMPTQLLMFMAGGLVVLVLLWLAKRKT